SHTDLQQNRRRGDTYPARSGCSDSDRDGTRREVIASSRRAGNRDRRRGARGLLWNDQARVLSGGNPVALGSPKPIERPPVAGVIPKPPELLEETTLLRRQPTRRLHDHADQLVSPTRFLERREALAAKPEDRAALDPRGDPQATRAVKGWDLDFRAQGCLGEGNRQFEQDVVAFAGEAFVRADLHRHVEVTGRRPRISRETAAGDPKLDAVRDAGRDLNRDRPRLRDPSFPVAARTRSLGPLAAPVALRARRDRDELTVAPTLGGAHLAPAVARRTGHDALPLGPRPAARRAGHRVMDRDLLPSASSDLFEVQLDLDARVLAGRRAATPGDRPTAEELLEQRPAESPALTEERLEQVPAEDVLDIPGVCKPGPVEAFAAPDLLLETVRAELVVDPTLLVVREDLVRLGALLELLFRALRVVFVQVRV